MILLCLNLNRDRSQVNDYAEKESMGHAKSQLYSKCQKLKLHSYISATFCVKVK